MKITDLKTYVVNNPTNRGQGQFTFVKLTTDDGIQGTGEAVRIGFGAQAQVTMIRDFADRYVIGIDPFKIEQYFRRAYSGTYRGGAARMGIISGIEMALWDIMGKAVNQPIYNLLGGKYHEKIRSYTYLYPVDTRVNANPRGTGSVFDNYPVGEGVNVQTDAQLAAERSAAYVKMGFTAVKLDPARPAIVPAPLQLPLQTLGNAEKVIKNVREAVGGKVDICIGTHGQMTTSSAIRLARRLEKYDPLWFEEPVPPENVAEMARVGHHTKIPIATGERNYTKYEFKELLQGQGAQVLQFTLGSVGGFMEAKKIAGMAEAYYAQIAPHMFAGPIATMANVQLDMCSPNFLIQEGVEAFGGFHAELLKKPIRWEQGYIIPPAEPGLGVELNDAVVQKSLAASG